MTYYKSKRPIDGKPPIWVIVDENGSIINRSPNKEELKDIQIEQYDKREGPKKYKIFVTIEENNSFFVAVDNGKLVKNPTDEDLRIATPWSYNKTNICYICRKENNITDNSILYHGNVGREKDEDREETGEWICAKHWQRSWERYDQNSPNNLIKSLRYCRTGNIDPSCNSAKGDLGENLTSIWRGVKKLSAEYDKYSLLPLDHSQDQELGVIQTKCSWYDIEYRSWPIKWENEWYKKFDNLIVYCISADGSIVERIYIFPREKVIMVTGTRIYKNPKNPHGDPKISWYDEYRLKDKEEIKKINEIWETIN